MVLPWKPQSDSSPISGPASSRIIETQGPRLAELTPRLFAQVCPIAPSIFPNANDMQSDPRTTLINQKDARAC